ncbi:hypothetical protein [Bradyrhizobium sp. CSA112]|uniref:hypothetical protein n=1 Tax=Bradyrhizobium sp. CSA112 TaxID=2699170 RepID=UPI0023B12025|nr:hypothetical protein [Bradyrhizobium sp. CSA112]
MSAARGWLSVSGEIHGAEVATAQSASPDRPSLEAVLHHLGKRRTCVQLFFRHACYDRISILDALLVDDPSSQPVAGKPSGDAIGYRVDVVRDQHVHDDAAARRQPGADGVARLDVEFIIKAKIRPADIDGNPVVKEIVIENEFPEVGHHQRQSIRQSKISLSDHEADRIVVDDRQLLSETRQPGGEISAAASQDENVRRAIQEFVHEPDIAEDALAVGRCLALPDAFLEIDPRSIRGAFDNFDCAIPALITPQQPHLTAPCIK